MSDCSQRSEKRNSKKSMKKLFGGIAGAVVGTLLGFFFGLVFGSAVTPESEYGTRVAIQLVICVPVGFLGGACAGVSMASEE